MTREVGYMAVDEDSQLSEEVKLRLAETFPAIGTWLERTSSLSGRPEQGSSLSKDDTLAHPYQISHAVIGALVSAVDHMDALRTLVQNARVVHARAPYTLLRGALENAAAAVWLLAPKNRTERILRRLRWQMEDAHNGVKAAGLINVPTALSRDEWKSKLADVARACGVPEETAGKAVNEPARFGTIVKEAGDAVQGLGNAQFYWMVTSGIAHAQTWAVLSALERVEVPGAPAGSVGLKLSASENLLLVTWMASARMVREGWRLLDERSTNHLCS